MPNTPWPVQKSATVGTSAEELRRNIAGMLALNSADPADVRVGVFRDSDAVLVSGTAGMGVNVRPFAAVFPGPLLVSSSAIESVTLDPKPASNSRIDLVWARAKRISGDGGSDADPGLIFGKTTGTPGAIPAAPSPPSGAVVLAHVTVTSTTTATNTATIVQKHAWTVSRGAPIPVRDLAERNGLTPVVGTRVLRLDKGGSVERYDVAALWVADGAGPGASVSRTTALSPPNTTTGNVDIEFTGSPDYDPAGMWSAGQPGRLTAKVAGIYRLTAAGGFLQSSGIIGAQVSVNGTPARLNTGTGSTQQTISVEHSVALAVGDYVTMQLYHERSGGNTIQITSDRKPRLTAQWVAP